MASPTKRTWTKRNRRDAKKLKSRQRKLRLNLKKKAKSVSAK